MARIFLYDNREFPDPDTSMTIDEVKATLADFLPEVANAAVKQSQRDGDTLVEFTKRTGTKGDMDNETLAAVIAQTPPVELQLLKLANSITNPDGTINMENLATLDAEFQEAIPQAMDYASSTHRLIGSLRCELQLP